MAVQYVYTMQGLTKTFPGGKKVFENVHLSFLPDAKIGVVGVNGAGKSTLLKIMAKRGRLKGSRLAICRRSRSWMRA
jgi:ATPase subunit of ABC transporter with duplicated ATPase domains